MNAIKVDFVSPDILLGNLVLLEVNIKKYVVLKVISQHVDSIPTRHHAVHVWFVISWNQDWLQVKCVSLVSSSVELRVLWIQKYRIFLFLCFLFAFICECTEDFSRIVQFILVFSSFFLLLRSSLRYVNRLSEAETEHNVPSLEYD
jgi:hypothetical protein